MQTQIKKLENLIWINIVNPELNAIRTLLAENGLNETLAEEILEPTLQAKVDTLRNAIYMTLHFPIKRGEETEVEEVDFLIKNNVIISSQYKEIAEIKTFVDNLDKININRRHNNQTHGGVYFAHFLKDIYSKLQVSVTKITEDIENIEKNIFSHEERKTIESISDVSKKIFDFRLALKQHKEVLEIYADSSLKIFGIEYSIYVDIINEEYKKIIGTLENQRDFLQDLKDTTNFLISNRTNQIVKVFTVVSFVILPLTFLSGFFGMNTKFPADLVTSPFGTVYIMGGMFFVSVCVLLYLHFKKLI
jgi:magnesium transporter